MSIQRYGETKSSVLHSSCLLVRPNDTILVKLRVIIAFVILVRYMLIRCNAGNKTAKCLKNKKAIFRLLPLGYW